MQRLFDEDTTLEVTLCAREVPHKSDNSVQHQKESRQHQTQMPPRLVRPSSKSDRDPATHPPVVLRLTLSVTRGASECKIFQKMQTDGPEHQLVRNCELVKDSTLVNHKIHPTVPTHPTKVKRNDFYYGAFSNEARQSFSDRYQTDQL